MLTNFLLLLLSSDCFHHLLFHKFFQIYTMTTVENSLDPDQVQPFCVGPDLGTYCLQTVSGDDNTSRS